MSKLLFEIENYRGEGAAATLFYEAKVTEAIALVVDAWKRQSRKQEKPLSDADRESLQNVVSYIADHYAFDIPLERLVSIACMSETKLKSCFKRQFGCSVTQYIQGRRMSQAEHLLINTDFTMGQIAQMIGYTPPAGSRSCSKRARASCPLSIGKSPGANKLATPQGTVTKAKCIVLFQQKSPRKPFGFRGLFQPVKKLPKHPCFCYNRGNGGVFMENWRKDARHEPIIVDLEALVPKEHLLRKIEKVMDYEWLYERLDPYYCHDNGRPGTDPVVLVKMVLIQHLFGIPSLRQTYREIQVNNAYRWFLGYGLLDNIPHFATVSYAFCQRFPDELTSEIFEHILNKALNNRMLDTSAIFIDGTHIKASANKKKFQKEQVAKAAKVYSGQLRREVNEEREKLGKKPIEDEDDENHPQGGGGSQETAEKTVSTTDPDCGMFVKGEHERQFAYEAHTACDKHGFVLGVEVTSGNVSDSVAWDAVYDKVTDRFPEVKFVTMDAGYKTPWIAKKIIEDSRIPILPYTRYKGKKDTFKPWDFTYNVVNDSFVCPGGHELRHTTTSKDGKRTYRSATQVCKDCPCRSVCGANENGQRMLTTHIWQEFLDLVEQLRKTERGKEIYALRKQTIERVFADAKEKHAMRYTHHRGLARVSAWVRLKYAAMNLKKLALWKWSRSDFFVFLPYFFFDTTKTPALA